MWKASLASCSLAGLFFSNPIHHREIQPGMAHNLNDTIALLERTPDALTALLRGLPDSWTRGDEGGDSWSAFDIVGHLIHGEKTDWLPRTRRILASGESKPFDKFDRLAQRRESKGKTLDQLLDEFTTLREENIDALQALNLTPADLAKKGKHPALGTVTLGQLLASWPVHDLTHLHQLSRVMAHQYRGLIGPWPKYMGVLQCQGHSE
jgi:hypothetical protein